jgi:hypothetical protein
MPNPHTQSVAGESRGCLILRVPFHVKRAVKRPCQGVVVACSFVDTKPGVAAVFKSWLHSERFT